MILDPDGDRAFSVTIGRNAVTVETQRPRRAPKDEVADLMQSLLRDALAMREREVGRGALYSSYQEEQEFRLRQREGGREFDPVYESVLKIVVDGWYESERLDFDAKSLLSRLLDFDDRNRTMVETARIESFDSPFGAAYEYLDGNYKIRLFRMMHGSNDLLGTILDQEKGFRREIRRQRRLYDADTPQLDRFEELLESERRNANECRRRFPAAVTIPTALHREVENAAEEHEKTIDLTLEVESKKYREEKPREPFLSYIGVLARIEGALRTENLPTIRFIIRDGLPSAQRRGGNIDMEQLGERLRAVTSIADSNVLEQRRWLDTIDVYL
jgi:hypothetical protein